MGFTPERSADALRVRNEAFRDHWGSTQATEESWAYFLRRPAFRAGLSFLAYSGAEPVAILLGDEWDADTAATGRRDFYISIVGTRRAARGRGIASALLSRALACASEAGFDQASLGVDADSLTQAVGLYERAGFRVRDTWIWHVKPLIAA